MTKLIEWNEIKMQAAEIVCWAEIWKTPLELKWAYINLCWNEVGIESIGSLQQYYASYYSRSSSLVANVNVALQILYLP